jgi:hypothetical protein
MALLFFHPDLACSFWFLVSGFSFLVSGFWLAAGFST